MSKAEEPNKLDKHTVTINDLDMGYKFVQCSSTEDRKRLEEIVYPFKGRADYVLYTRLGGEQPQQKQYGSLEEALNMYNKIGKHKVKKKTFDCLMNMVIASSFSSRQKKLSFRWNAHSLKLQFCLTWKNPGKEKSYRLTESCDEAINLYNSI